MNLHQAVMLPDPQPKGKNGIALTLDAPCIIC